MPADVNTFDMLRRNVLEGMTCEELIVELERVRIMEQTVAQYRELVLEIRWCSAKGGNMAKNENDKDVQTGRPAQNPQMKALKTAHGTPTRQSELPPYVSKDKMPGETD